MLLIQDMLVSEDVVKRQFFCELETCKGACCWEGDFGAPLEKEELSTLETIYDNIKPFLAATGRKVIEKNGLFVYYEEPKEFGTTLLENGACAYMTTDKNGIAMCGIEQAYIAGVTTFKKPVSCHLYPIRVTENQQNGFKVVKFEYWDICSAACSLGKRKQLPVFKFVKEALIRKFGTQFYNELDSIAQYL